MNMYKAQKVISSPWGFTSVGTKIKNILCSDDVQRVFVATQEPDTFFTTPGRVQVNGKSINGHAYHDNMIWSDDYPDGLWKFSAYTYKKNGDILPPWKKECSECHKEIELGREIHTFSYYYYHSECLVIWNAKFNNVENAV